MQITTTKPPLGWQTKSQYEKSRRKAAPPEEKQQRGKQLGLENARFNVRGVLQVESDSDLARVKYKEGNLKDARSQNGAIEEATIESKIQVKYKNDERGERSTSAGIKAKATVGRDQNILSREKERTQEEKMRRREKVGSIEVTHDERKRQRWGEAGEDLHNNNERKGMGEETMTLSASQQLADWLVWNKCHAIKFLELLCNVSIVLERGRNGNQVVVKGSLRGISKVGAIVKLDVGPPNLLLTDNGAARLRKDMHRVEERWEVLIRVPLAERQGEQGRNPVFIFGQPADVAKAEDWIRSWIGPLNICSIGSVDAARGFSADDVRTRERLSEKAQEAKLGASGRCMDLGIDAESWGISKAKSEKENLVSKLLSITGQSSLPQPGWDLREKLNLQRKQKNEKQWQGTGSQRSRDEIKPIFEGGSPMRFGRNTDEDIIDAQEEKRPGRKRGRSKSSVRMTSETTEAARSKSTPGQEVRYFQNPTTARLQQHSYGSNQLKTRSTSAARSMSRRGDKETVEEMRNLTEGGRQDGGERNSRPNRRSRQEHSCGGSGTTEQPEGTLGERRSISAGRILCKGEDRRGMSSSRIGIGARRVRSTSAIRSTEAIRRPSESFKILELNNLGNRHGDHRDPDKRRRRVTFCDDVIEHEPCCYSDESQEDGKLEDDHEEKQGRAVNEEEENYALNE